MSISNVGGVIYTNQNTPVVAHAQQSEQAKTIAQNFVASELMQEKEKTIEETKPTKETQKVKPQKDSEEKEQKKEKKKKRKDLPHLDSEIEELPSFLDIKV